MKKIELQSHPANFQIWLTLLVVCLLSLLLILYKPSEKIGYIFIIIFIYKFLKEKNFSYVYCLNIADTYIELIYKNNGKVIYTQKIEKESIKLFEADINITEFGNAISDYYTDVNIYLLDGRKINFKLIEPSIFDINTWINMWTHPYYQSAVNLVKAHKFIPNFKYRVNGSYYCEQELLHHYQGKKWTFAEKIKAKYNSSALDKFIVIFVSAALLYVIFLIIYLIVGLNT